jgi:nucleoside-diphosphate-sugar epimerase
MKGNWPGTSSTLYTSEKENRQRDRQVKGSGYRGIGFLGSLGRSPCIEKARKELGYTPRYSLEEGLRETVQWYRQNGMI